MPDQPVLLMAFAENDLPEVRVEAEKCWNHVINHPSIKAIKLEDAEIADLAEALIDHHQNLCFFHFGGHASTTEIALDSNQKVDKYQLSRLLISGMPRPLQWVFLNACETFGHVGILTASGVKAVIATNQQVNSKQAAQLARFFYKCFFEQKFTLKAAFEMATATLPGFIAQTLITNPGEINENTPLNANWGLYIHSKHQEVLNWTLDEFVQFVKKDKIKNQTTHGNGNAASALEETLIVGGAALMAKLINDNTGGYPELNNILEKINNDDLQGAFDLLDLVDFGNRKGTYIQLKNEFIDMPVGGSRRNLRERLSLFVKMQMK